MTRLHFATLCKITEKDNIKARAMHRIMGFTDSPSTLGFSKMCRRWWM